MTLVLVADGSRARLFRLERDAMTEPNPETHLTELEDLVNMEQELRGHELFENLKSGRNRAPVAGPAHGYDDHREEQRREHQRRFAKRVVECVARTAANDHHTLVLVADPRTLGVMREQLRKASLSMKTTELGVELSAATPHQIHEHLATAGLLPARRPS